MTTKKVANQTVYLCYINEFGQLDDPLDEKESIKRMALHPMVVDEEGIIDEEFRDAEFKEERFPFRVVFKDNGKWHYSCLGIDADVENPDYDWRDDDGDDDELLHAAGDSIGNGTADEALRWLLEGEKNMEELLDIAECRKEWKKK